jgi:hypothetical protein
MAQYDILLTQNVHATLVEYSEKFVNLSKGDLLSAIADQTPTVLAGGTDGYMLVRDDVELTGLKWVVIAAGHTQNTDTGTTSLTFELDNDGFQIELTAESASKFGVKVNGGATYADIEAKDATFAKVTVVTAPSAGSDLTNKTYVDGILGANDAMTFKGTIGTAGTYTIAAFNALVAWDAGDTYKVIEAGTIRGNVCEIGDMLIATVDRASGGVDADWTVVQTNIDGAVTGPVSSTDGYFAIWDGTSGTLIKDGAGSPGTMAYETAADYLTTAAAATTYVAQATFNAHTILYATTDNTPVALTVAEQTIVGRITSGNIDALTASEVMGILWQSAPVTYDAAGTLGDIAYDDDYFYVCTVGGIATVARWNRAPLALNWT